MQSGPGACGFSGLWELGLESWLRDCLPPLKQRASLFLLQQAPAKCSGCPEGRHAPYRPAKSPSLLAVFLNVRRD